MILDFCTSIVTVRFLFHHVAGWIMWALCDFYISGLFMSECCFMMFLLKGVAYRAGLMNRFYKGTVQAFDAKKKKHKVWHISEVLLYCYFKSGSSIAIYCIKNYILIFWGCCELYLFCIYCSLLVRSGSVQILSCSDWSCIITVRVLVLLIMLWYCSLKIPYQVDFNFFCVTFHIQCVGCILFLFDLVVMIIGLLIVTMKSVLYLRKRKSIPSLWILLVPATWL